MVEKVRKFNPKKKEKKEDVGLHGLLGEDNIIMGY